MKDTQTVYFRVLQPLYFLKMDELRRQIELQDQLIQNKRKLRNRNHKNRLHLIGIQEKVEDVLKPVIDPLKKIDEGQQSLKEQISNQQNQSNQLAIQPPLPAPIANTQQIQQYQPIQTLNTDPIPGKTEKLTYGIRPQIFKNRNPPEFYIGNRKIPINLDTNTFDLKMNDETIKIPIRQNLINLINGDLFTYHENDTEYFNYEYEDYVDYSTLLNYVKGKGKKPIKRMKELEKEITDFENLLKQNETNKITIQQVESEQDDQEAQEELINEVEKEIGSGINKLTMEELFDKLKLLISARNEGHNNLDDNIQKILEELLKSKAITKNDCVFFS